MKRTVFPPNCEVRNSNPSRLLEFVAKQRRVFAEYGFWLSVPLKTQAEKDGHKRYIREWHRRYRAENRERLSAYHREYWKTVLKPGFTSKAEAVGDEEKLKRRAAKRAAEAKRAEYEAHKLEIHEKYGFWLNTPPKTPEEIAGRERYRREWGKAYKAAHAEQTKAQRKERSKRDKVRREQKFQEKYAALKTVDPAKAEMFRRQRESLCLIQNMTNEERVRYRQQKQYEKLKARAEREAARKAEREARKEERKRLKRERSAAAHREKCKAEKHVRRDLWLAKCAERRAEAAAVAELERVKAAAFASEREANRAAYLAAKAAVREEGMNRAETGVLDTSLTEFTELRAGPTVVAESSFIVVDEYLPHHPLRGLTLEETAPTDEELADDTPPPEIDYAAGDPPDDPPGDAPTVHTGGDDGSEPDDEFSAFDNMSLEEKKHYTIEKYGFTWGEKPTTPEEIAGHKRYTADRQRATAELNKRIDELLNGRSRKIRAAVKKRKATIARKRREEAAQAARAAREAEREARRKVQEAKRKERETERQAAREAKAAKLEAERRERAAFKARARELGIPLQKARWTPKHQRIWDRALRREEKAKIEAERAAKRAARQGEQTHARQEADYAGGDRRAEEILPRQGGGGAQAQARPNNRIQPRVPPSQACGGAGGGADKVDVRAMG